jgi:hypothetical protein
MSEEKLISPSINAGIVDRHRVKDRLTGEYEPDAEIEAVRSAVDSLRAACIRSQDAAKKIKSNPLQTNLANHRDVRDAVYKLWEPASVAADKALERSERAIENLNKAMTPPRPKDAHESVVQVEIVKRLGRLPVSERNAAIADAIRDEDETVVAALSNCSRLLSGLTQNDLNMHLMTWKQRKHAADLDRVRRLQASMADLARAQAASLGFVSSCYDAEQVDAAERSERAARDAVKKDVA